MTARAELAPETTRNVSRTVTLFSGRAVRLQGGQNPLNAWQRTMDGSFVRREDIRK